jgi:hypothetical protein
MKGKHIAIYGSSGALPLWIDTANALVNRDYYTEKIQPADLAFEPPEINLPTGSEDIQTVPVSYVTGLPLGLADEMPESSSLPGVVSEVTARGDTWELKRHFEPLKGKTE